VGESISCWDLRENYWELWFCRDSRLCCCSFSFQSCLWPFLLLRLWGDSASRDFCIVSQGWTLSFLLTPIPAKITKSTMKHGFSVYYYVKLEAFEWHRFQDSTSRWSIFDFCGIWFTYWFGTKCDGFSLPAAFSSEFQEHNCTAGILYSFAEVFCLLALGIAQQILLWFISSLMHRYEDAWVDLGVCVLFGGDKSCCTIIFLV